MTHFSVKRVANTLTIWFRDIPTHPANIVGIFMPDVSITNSKSCPTAKSKTMSYGDIDRAKLYRKHYTTTYHKDGGKTMHFRFDDGKNMSLRFWLRPDVTVGKF